LKSDFTSQFFPPSNVPILVLLFLERRAFIGLFVPLLFPHTLILADAVVAMALSSFLFSPRVPPNPGWFKLTPRDSLVIHQGKLRFPILLG